MVSDRCVVFFPHPDEFLVPVLRHGQAKRGIAEPGIPVRQKTRRSTARISSSREKGARSQCIRVSSHEVHPGGKGANGRAEDLRPGVCPAPRTRERIRPDGYPIARQQGLQWGICAYLTAGRGPGVTLYGCDLASGSARGGVCRIEKVFRRKWRVVRIERNAFDLPSVHVVPEK